MTVQLSGRVSMHRPTLWEGVFLVIYSPLCNENSPTVHWQGVGITVFDCSAFAHK